MNQVEERAKLLAKAIEDSEEYQRFLKVKKEVEQNEMLCHKIDEFREKNFVMHANLEGEELYNAMENFEREHAAFRKDPLVSGYLAAELTMIRMIQKTEKTLLDAVDFDLVFTPAPEEEDDD